MLNFSAGFSDGEIKLQADFERPDTIFFLFADHDLFLGQPQRPGGARFSCAITLLISVR